MLAYLLHFCEYGGKSEGKRGLSEPKITFKYHTF